MKALLLVNGAGLGNSVRMEQVVLALQKQNIIYDVLCSGNAHLYFKAKNINHTELQQLQYGTSNGKLSIFKTFSPSNIAQNIRIFKVNNLTIKKLIQNNDYDFAIIDSFYSVKALKKQNIPIYAINNSNLLYENFDNIKYKFNFQTKLHFYFIEFFDYLFHSKNVKKAFSLNFYNGKNSYNFIDTPIIAKSNLIQKVKDNNILFMLSGSNWTSNIKIQNYKNWVEKIKTTFVIGIDPNKVTISDSIQNKFNLIGRTYEATDYINKSKIAIINAGFSAISEMISAKKPMIIIPLANHSEQQFNALLISKLGLGIIADVSNWEEKLFELINNHDFYQNNFEKLESKYLENGANFVVNEILKDFSNGK